MRTILTLLAIFLAGAAGASLSFHGPVPGLLAGAVAYLLIEVVALRRRINRLETSLAQIPRPERQTPPPESAQASWREERADDRVQPSAVSLEPLPGEQTAAPADAAPAAVPPMPPSDRVPDLLARLLHWLTGGNPVLKAGIVVLFFGVAFLLNYAAQRNLLPIELRLAGVAAGALVLLLLGWRLRHGHALYGLGLEGAGIGILYLVVFASAKVYHLLPLPLALAVMIGLVGLSCALAVLQNARGLAVAGSVGGFLAPVLMSSGGGSHVLLFSYYAFLNGGILAIAWFKAWRELHLTGFVFTFGVAALWGTSAYIPAHFATTEPFLILFFVMYCLIAVLFAHRQPLHLRGVIDGPLVFGLPIVASGLQACLVIDVRHGLAFSALALGGWYLGLARLLWNRMGAGMRLLTEAFLALGVVFASLAIPLGLDPHWTTAAWALEGAALVWVGIRQHRRSARIFGLLLQLGAALAFIDSPANSGAILFANRLFLGCGLLAAAGILSAYWLDRHQGRPFDWEGPAARVLLAWGLAWWHVGGFADLDRHVDGQALFPVFLLFSGTTAAGLGAAARWFRWSRLFTALLLLLPLMLLAFCAQAMDWHGNPLLTGWGWLAWPLAMALQYGLLFRFQDDLPRNILPLWHQLTLWLLLAVVTVEAAWRVDHLPGLAGTWSLACWGLVPVAFLSLLEWQGDRLVWPVARFARAYHGIGTDVPLALLLLWLFASLAVSGDPVPLPYLPLCNPLELAELAILLLAAFRGVRAARKGNAPHWWLLAVAALAFFWLNAVVGRSVHFFAGVPYRLDALFASSIMQAGIAALWSVLALALTIRGARRGHRPLWLGGAGLLGLTVIKLFLVDLSGTGAIGRIVSFLVVGLLMLVIGFFAPLPPRAKEPSP